MASALYENIADMIQSKIRAGEYQANERLPSERMMAQAYQVSRNVIREALKLLSEKGVVSIQPGRGAFVASPGENKIAEKLELVIRDSSTDLLELLDVREILETAIIRRAIRDCTPDALTRLRELYEQMQRSRRMGYDFSALDSTFHEIMADCANNEMLGLLTKTFYKAADERLFMVVDKNPRKLAQAQKEHKRMIDSIECQDEQQAVAAVREHINCIREQVIGRRI